MPQGALYYPYIHVRDANWLKGTLLLFDQVQRMVPFPTKVEGDDPAILPFAQWRVEKPPLLRPARLWDKRATHAQRELAKKLRAAAKVSKFMRDFGVHAAAAQRQLGHGGFQIHQMKLHPDLRDALRVTRLGWHPRTLGPSDPHGEYIEVHPEIGQAVMATLAIACAKQDGLHIVADPSSGALHECLMQKNQSAVFQTWLGTEPPLPEPRRPEPHELLEYLVTVHCDASSLTAADLEALQKDREPLQQLMKRLQDVASAVEPMDPRARRQAVADAVSLILRQWKEDRRNLAPFWQRFFGVGLLDKGASFAEKMLAGLVNAAPGASAGAGAGAVLVDAGAGLGVGLVTHVAKSIVEVRRERRESPVRYLTAMQRQGVVFRFEAREPV